MKRFALNTLKILGLLYLLINLNTLLLALDQSTQDLPEAAKLFGTIFGLGVFLLALVLLWPFLVRF